MERLYVCCLFAVVPLVTTYKRCSRYLLLDNLTPSHSPPPSTKTSAQSLERSPTQHLPFISISCVPQSGKRRHFEVAQCQWTSAKNPSSFGNYHRKCNHYVKLYDSGVVKDCLSPNCALSKAHRHAQRPMKSCTCQKEYEENRRVVNLIQDWCEPCRRAAWATLDREDGW
ncbi:hypothetical protein BDY19DRAFT_300969 [Irpex rosettiformis]|uniref:Uncharacterized protein n=1 Tax=Irpex rosettiformis TaxID=378272 RepID=A0ACB8TZ60_9APHY|nr:hypothetical protein BDY19DRAFT_300969 [Irpex rosettiformis]